MNPLRAWSDFWFRPTSAGPLGLFRVLMGLIALAHIGLLANESDYWLSDQGLYQGTEAIELAGPLRPSPLQYFQDPLSVSLYLGASAFIAVLFTVGYKSRINAVLLYLAVLTIQHRNIYSHGGPDSLLLILLFCLMFSPCGAAFSIDAFLASRKRGTQAEPIILPWAQRLIQLQIALVYFDTAILKVHGGTWLDGTALHLVLTNGEFSRFPDTWLPQYPIVINLMTHAALLLEFMLPAFLWFRATRIWMIALGVMLHLGILATIHVNLFSEMMIASYLTFLAPGEFQALIRPFRRSFWLGIADRAKLPEGLRLDSAEELDGPLGALPTETSPANTNSSETSLVSR